MRKKRYKGNKLNLFKVRVLPVLVLLAAFTLMFSISAFSSDVKDRYISFNGDNWNFGDAEEPTPTWLTKERDVTFTVNLKEDYRAYSEGKDSQEIDQNAPFNVTGKYGRRGSVTTTVDPVNPGENFAGEYVVTAQLPSRDRTTTFTIDFGGNSWGIDSDKKTFQVTKDTEAPKVTLDATVNNSNANGKRVEKAVNVKINALDENLNDVVIEATRNGEDISNQFPWENKQIDHKLEQNGEYTIKVTATDKLGNKAEKTVAFAIAIGDSSLKVNGKKAGQMKNDITNGSTVQGGIMEFEVTHTLPIQSATVEVKGPAGAETNLEETLQPNGTSFTWSKDFSEEDFLQGTYEVRVEVKDNYKASPIEISPHPFIFTIDRTAPVITIQGAEDGSDEVKVSIAETNYMEEKTNVKITRKGLDGTKTIVNRSPGAEKGLHQKLQKDGVYTVEVTAKDKAGNESSKTLSFTVDKTEPKLTLSEEIDQKHYKDSKTITFTIEDLTLNRDITKTYLQLLTPSGEEETLEFVKNQDNDYLAQLQQDFTEEGVYEITIVAQDKFENKTEVTKTFTIDKTAPELSIKAGDVEIPDGKYFTDPTTININVDDANYAKNKTSLTVKRNDTVIEKVKLEDGSFKDLVLDNNGQLTVPFSKNGHYEITLQSTDKAGNEEDLTVLFTIDKDSPVFDISGVSENGYYPSADVTFTVTDFTLDHEATNLIYQRNGDHEGEILLTEDSLQKATASALFGKAACDREQWEENHDKALICEEGNYTIIFSSQDLAGNGRAQLTLPFTIDYRAPEINLSGFADGDYKQNGDLEIEVEENFNLAEISVEVNGEKVESVGYEDSSDPEKAWAHVLSFNKDGENKDDGDYTVKVTAKDKAGNKSVKEVSFVIDSKSPEVLINGVEMDSYYAEGKTATITVTERNYDEKNILEYVDVTVTKDSDEVRLDTEEKWKKGANDDWTLHLEFADDGVYTINVTAKDQAGNDPASKELSFTIDNINPKLSIEGVENNHNYKSAEATITVTDTNIDLDNTILTITKGGKQYDAGTLTMVEGTSTAELTYNFTEEGAYGIKLKTTDKAGRTAEHEDVSFIIDSTAPVIDIQGVANGSYQPKDTMVTLAVTEHNYRTNTVDIKVTRNGENYADFPVENWKNIGKDSKLRYNFREDGRYNISISATDKAGNGPVTKKITFTIDKTKPAIDISGVYNGEHYNVNKTVTIGIADTNLDINKATVTRNGSSYNAGSFSTSGNKATLVHTFTAEGEYNILVEATDKAGNIFTKEINFTIDKTAPVITPYVGGESHIIKDGEYINRMFTPNFSLDVKEDRIVSVLLNGKDVTGKVPAITVDGQYDFKVTARDKAGNESEISFGFTLDVTMPKLDISGVVDGYFNSDVAPVVTYSDKNLDKEKTYVTLNGQPYKSGTKLQYEQDYVLKAHIVDLAGNVTARSIVFTIDKTAPSIKFMEPISEQYFNSSIIPELIVEDMSSYDIISMTLNGEPYEVGQKINDEGKHVLYFEVKDAADNIKQLSVEFIIDTTPPKIIFEGVKKNEVYYDPVYVRISLDNPFDRIQTATVNGELFEGDVSEKDGQKFIKINATQLGDYEIKVLAVDEAGNTADLTLPFTIAEKSLLMKVYENKPLFAGSVAGAVALLSAAATLGYRRIRKNNTCE